MQLIYTHMSQDVVCINLKAIYSNTDGGSCTLIKYGCMKK